MRKQAKMTNLIWSVIYYGYIKKIQINFIKKQEYDMYQRFCLNLFLYQDIIKI